MCETKRQGRMLLQRIAVFASLLTILTWDGYAEGGNHEKKDADKPAADTQPLEPIEGADAAKNADAGTNTVSRMTRLTQELIKKLMADLRTPESLYDASAFADDRKLFSRVGKESKEERERIFDVLLDTAETLESRRGVSLKPVPDETDAFNLAVHAKRLRTEILENSVALRRFEVASKIFNRVTETMYSEVLSEKEKRRKHRLCAEYAALVNDFSALMIDLLQAAELEGRDVLHKANNDHIARLQNIIARMEKEKKTLKERLEAKTIDQEQHDETLAQYERWQRALIRSDRRLTEIGEILEAQRAAFDAYAALVPSFATIQSSSEIQLQTLREIGDVEFFVTHVTTNSSLLRATPQIPSVDLPGDVVSALYGVATNQIEAEIERVMSVEVTTESGEPSSSAEAAPEGSSATNATVVAKHPTQDVADATSELSQSTNEQVAVSSGETTNTEDQSVGKSPGNGQGITSNAIPTKEESEK